ncbi:MAG: dihydropteroate synthase-like protein [Candidatus Helarchaeota archaeon]
MNKKILILTGKLAENDVRNYLNKYTKDEIEIKVLNCSLAAFITPNLIINELKGFNFSDYQYIMVPGLMVGKLDDLEKKLNISIYRGPKYACDIPVVIDSQIPLSKNISADKLLMDYGLNEYDKLIEKINLTKKEILKINNLKIGNGYPPRILAEIVDAPRLSIDKIIFKARYYIENGADMLDIGSIVGENNSQKLQTIIEEIRSIYEDIPISIDSLNPEEIETAVNAGANLVLSLDEGNIKDLKNLDKNVCYTIIPTNISKGYFPKDPESRINKLKQNIELANKFGFKKILADPLLESPINPGLTNSLVIYHKFKTIFPEIPTLAGIGNVFELIDADSIGINAILAAIVVELNISVCLTTEYSKKSRNAVNELATGLRMAFIANYKNQPPIGLPFNLLKAKSKKDLLPSYKIKNEIIIKNLDQDEYIADPKGYFKIWIDHLEKKIMVNYNKNNQLQYTISGNDAETIGKKIIKLDLISKLEHSLYLGRELEKAEICLYLGKTYAQDIQFKDT